MPFRKSWRASRKEVGGDEGDPGLFRAAWILPFAAALIRKAIGDQIVYVFVDTGLLRLNESQRVMEMFHDQRHMEDIVHVIDASEHFLRELKGRGTPNRNARLSAACLLKVFQRESAKRVNAKLARLGHDLPDVIESNSAKTKRRTPSSHHVGGFAGIAALGIAGAAARLFQDRCANSASRWAASRNGLSPSPFPGAGDWVLRILGSNEGSRRPSARADSIFIRGLQHEG